MTKKKSLTIDEKIKLAELKYPPNDVQKFIINNFGGRKWTPAKFIVFGVFFVFNILAIIFYERNNLAINPATGVFLIIANGWLPLLAIPWIYTFHSNNSRIKKIAKEAGLSLEEYQKYVS